MFEYPDGVVEQITVPYLITHGANDRQIPIDDAHRSYEQATASPQRALKIFTEHEGGAEHVNSDDQPNAARFHRRLGRRDLRHRHRLTGGQHAHSGGDHRRRPGRTDAVAPAAPAGGRISRPRPPQPAHSDTGRHSASRSTTSRQARWACRGW